MAEKLIDRNCLKHSQKGITQPKHLKSLKKTAIENEFFSLTKQRFYT